jgi:hypothetical protein
MLLGELVKTIMGSLMYVYDGTLSGLKDKFVCILKLAADIVGVEFVILCIT